MTDAPASSPVELGQNPEDLEFGCGAVDGKVVVRFNTLVQWFDMDPALTIAFAEKLITSAQEASAGKIVTPNRAQRRELIRARQRGLN